MLGAASAATAPSSIWQPPPPSGCLLHLAASSIWQPPAGPRPAVSHAAFRCRRLLPSAVADPQQQQQGQQQQQQPQPAPVYLQDGRTLALMTAFREKLGGKKNKLKCVLHACMALACSARTAAAHAHECARHGCACTHHACMHAQARTTRTRTPSCC